MATHYFINNRLLASTPVLPKWADGVIQSHSSLFMCEVCGEVWGRILIDGLQWLPLIRRCAKHKKPTRESEGSFISSWIHDISYLPSEVLRYELNLRLARLPE